MTARDFSSDWTIPVLDLVMMGMILQTGRLQMAIGIVIALVLVPAAIIVALMMKNKTVAQPEPAPPVIQTLNNNIRPPQPKITVAESRPAVTITVQASSQPSQSPPVTAPEPPKVPAVIAVSSALTTAEDRRERILAGISENIRKSLSTRQAAQSSPVLYKEVPRNTEYVRVKKDVITPHGQVRFSILKDWMSTNMLAVFRRASSEWKTPEDLIAFVPAYLEPEAEILNSQVLLVSTPGHNEKLAVPIRNLDDIAGLRQCFEFVSAAGAVTMPAVVVTSDCEFEIVSRGVITQALFTNAIDQGREMKLLVNAVSE